ncbi:MAG: Polyketide cyclase/dehydrase [Solirubrobacterales bacterium]|nr:Polyketide cyclase/dehydrase [Solirubrobacterales bacterium]
MPTVARSREVAATPDAVWQLVGDPYHLPRWWPRVSRVEAVAGGRFTEVLGGTKSGRAVRADFRVDEKRKNERLRFSQELEGSPFERVLKSSETEIALAPSGAGTRVAITTRQKLRGLSRLGGFLVKRATRKVLDEALDGLEATVGQA